LPTYILEDIDKAPLISKRLYPRTWCSKDVLRCLNLVKDQLFFSSLLFSSHQEDTKMNLINSVHRRVVEYQIKQLKNELSKFED